MMTTVKGELALYNQHFILGQIMQAQNPSSDLKNYSCNPIEIKLIISLYNTETGYFFELKTTLAYILLRGDLVIAMAIIKKIANSIFDSKR